MKPTEGDHRNGEVHVERNIYDWMYLYRGAFAKQKRTNGLIASGRKAAL
jgi:hypothetical protein